VTAGHNVNIVLINDHGFHPVFERDEFIRSITYKANKGLFSLLSLIKKLNVDLIHTHGYKAGILGRLLKIFHKKALVSTFHAGEKGNLKMRFYCLLDRLTSLITYRICVSEQIAKSIGKDARVIQNFIEMPKELPSSTKNASQIAFVGRFSIEKGPDIFCSVAKKSPLLNFTMYGDGPMYSEIKQTKPNNVDLIGHVDSMNEHWKNIKLLCITSREEGLPLAALEALGRGIPIVSYDVGGLANVVFNHKTGWLVPPLDENAFANCIELSCQLSEEEVNQISLFSIEFIKNKFSSQAIIPLITQCYGIALNNVNYAE
jgi:glycosyltransferase involved in cell wall biosynthesis